MTSAPRLHIAAAVVLAACGVIEGLPDRGAAALPDAGRSEDAGAIRDGGRVDAGGTDAGSSRDVGVDAGSGSAGPRYEIDGRYRWAALPLRSAELARLGEAGGEGMQWPFDIEFAPSDARRAYLVTDTSQVWRSDDAGESWRRAAGGFQPLGGLSLAVDPDDADRVLVAGSVHLLGRHAPAVDGIWMTEDGGDSWARRRVARFLRDHYGGDNFAFGERADQVLAGSHGDGLFVSRDGGVTWASLPSLPNAVVRDVAAVPDALDDYLVATADGLQRVTVDGGTTTLGSLPAAPINVEIDPTDAMRVWVTVEDEGVYRSLDGGVSFDAATGGMGYRTVNWLEVSPANAERLYASMQNTGGNTIFLSSDGADRWARNTSIFSHEDVSANRGGFFFGTPFAASPTDPQRALAMAAANLIVRTDDGGQTWDYSSDGFTGSRVLAHGHDFEGHADGTYTLFLVDFGVVRTEDDGNTFRNLNAPLYRGRLTTHAGASQPGSGGRVIVTAVGNYTEQRITVSTDGGDSWTPTPHTGAIDLVRFLPDEPDTVYAGAFRSRDAGTSWVSLPRAVRSVHPDDDSLYAFDDRRTLRSDDGGDTWDEAFAPLPCAFAELEFKPIAPFTAFALGQGCGLHEWADGAWRELGPDQGLALDALGSRDARSIAFSPEDPDFVCVGKWAAYRAQTNGVFCSGDGGASWRDFTFDLDRPFTPWSLAFHPDGRLFMGSSHGNFILEPAEDATG